MPRGIFTLLVPLQTIEDIPLPDTLEDKPYAPLFGVSKYLENDPNVTMETNLKYKTFGKMNFCERLKIVKF